MVPRASIRWAGRLASSSTARARASSRNSRIWQAKSCRGYASQGSGHGSQKSSSDLPWAVTSAAISIPAAFYLMQSAPDTGHGHGHGEGEHGEGHDEEGEEGEDESTGEVIEPVPNLRKGSSDEGDEESEQNSTEGGDGKDQSGEDGGEEKEDDQPSDSGSEGEGQEDTPDTSDDEQSKNVAHETQSGRNVDGVQFKGSTSGGTEEGEQGDTRKHIPDAKGGNKKRIESDYGNRLGVASDDDQEKDEDGRTIDKPAASKAPGGRATQSGKQEGLSNTDTKHSTDIANDPDKSKKGEGVPETAKSKGTVNPQRPPAENRPGPDESDKTTR